MGLFSKKTIITNNTGSVITVGYKNLIKVSQKLSDILENDIQVENKDWDIINEELLKIQKEIRSIPDKYEIIRDEELTPLISILKRDAKEFKDNPNKEKKPFIEKIKSLIDITGKVAELGAKLTPFFVKLLSIFGIVI